MEKYHGNTVEYWKQNAEEDYIKTPISVLKYITVLEEQVEQLRQHFVIGSLPLDSEVINNCPQNSFGTREVWMRGVVWLKERVLKGNDR